MIVFYILLGILAVILLILFLPLRLYLRLDEEGKLRTRVSVCVVPILQLPKKIPPFRQRSYSPRAIAKREKKRTRRAAAKLRKEQKKQEKRNRKRTTPSQGATQRKRKSLGELTDIISLITSLFGRLTGPLFRYIRVDVHALTFRIATGDAAKTALLFGAVCPAVTLLFETLHQISNLYLHHPENIIVFPDFQGERPSISIDIRIRLRVWHLLSVGWQTLTLILTRKNSPKYPVKPKVSPKDSASLTPD